MSKILSNKFYAGIFMWLIVFTGVTVGLSLWKIGPWYNISIGIVIASVKATIVALFFMHLKYETKLIFTIVIIPLILLVILMFALMPDVVYAV